MTVMLEVEPRLAWFVEQMRTKLAVPENQSKDDWRDQPVDQLVEGIDEEMGELFGELQELADEFPGAEGRTILELADVANRCMMLADRIHAWQTEAVRECPRCARLTLKAACPDCENQLTRFALPNRDTSRGDAMSLEALRDVALHIHIRDVRGGPLRTIAIYPLSTMPVQPLILDAPIHSWPVTRIPFHGPIDILCSIEVRPPLINPEGT